MAKISIDRHVILPVGVPSSGVSLNPGDDGTLHFAVWGEGVRVLVQFATEESVQTGVGFIMQAGEVARRLAAIRPAPPVIIGGGKA